MGTENPLHELKIIVNDFSANIDEARVREMAAHENMSGAV